MTAPFTFDDIGEWIVVNVADAFGVEPDTTGFTDLVATITGVIDSEVQQ